MGISNFLCSQHTFFFRARTDVSVYVLGMGSESAQGSPHNFSRRSLANLSKEIRGVDGVLEEQKGAKLASAAAHIPRLPVGEEKTTTSASTMAWLVWKKLNAVQV